MSQTESEVCLWNGLPAKLYPLKTCAPLLKRLREELKPKPDRYVFNPNPKMPYWVVEVGLDVVLEKEPIYLIVGHTGITREKIMKTVVTKRDRLHDRILYIVYMGTAHYWGNAPAYQLLLKAVDEKTSPRILALLG
jgi:hypothetical protein